MGEPELDPAAVTAEFDQVGASLRSFSVPLGEFYDALLTQGFHNEEAFTLARDYFNHMLENASLEDDD